ncbi:MAG: hypothetical protein JRF02_06320 [Deltaproteobacteria bacterium]|jgi:hypothetical protein|nr:hypothetical protein [Deltaproteobacteria bacterium]
MDITMKSAMKSSYYGLWQWALPLCFLVFSALLSDVVLAKESKGSAVDSDPEVIRSRVMKSLTDYDMNAMEKNLIDFSFSPLQAMPVYRSLLLWARDNPENEGLKAEMLTAVRDGMVSVVRDSGMGVRLSDWSGPGQPISLMFSFSQPRYSQVINPSDPSTLRWREAGHVDNVTPGTIGLSLAVKALMLSELDSFQDKERDALILASLLEELDILGGKLFYKSKLGPAEKGAYVPEVLSLDEGGAWQIDDSDSKLLSHLYLLQGLTHIYSVFSDEMLVERLFAGAKVHARSAEEWRKYAYEVMKIVYESTIENHNDSATGSFISDFSTKKGPGKKMLVRDIGVLADTLNTMLDVLPDDDQMRAKIAGHLKQQATYTNDMLGGKLNRIPKAVLVSKKIPVYGMTQELSDAISLMSLMLLAYKADGNEEYLSFVKKHFASIKSDYWSEHGGTYRSAKGYKVSSYSGEVFSQVLSWMQHMHWELPELMDFHEQSHAFIQAILKKGGLLQAETSESGETRSMDEYLRAELDSMVDELIAADTTEHGTIIENFVKRAADQDQDGVPGISFAGGDYGAAPVVIIGVSVPTPFYEAKPGKDGSLRRNYGF